ncbi:MAG: chromosome segregation protein SMC [Candidatus Omnitrophota bacterium]
MYFKRLELFGFKSFAEKTKLKFEPGVTAVVGPNGCGKSNISDSIKWVLGEQSAKELRGSRMEDVIFNGTSNKEPINMAEVSLVLSNKDKKLPIDYEEVVITRRLFRSGESHYLLNKMPVRLKDINDLLAGTGIGQSSYSIIEQGRIGLVLSSKPEERRYIFEEASGITKYKAKKKEALKKLEHTETNLIRINDILTEVQRQIQSIERQARKAEKYKKDFEVCKDLELKFSLFQYRNITNEMKTMEIEGQDLKKREDEKAAQYGELAREAQGSRQLIDRVNEDLQKAMSEFSETEAAIDKNSHSSELNRERIGELKALAEKLKEDIKFLEEKLRRKKEDLGEYRNRLSVITVSRNEKEEALKGHEERIGGLVREIGACQEDVKKNKVRIMDVLTTQTKAKNELIKIGAEIQNRRIRLGRLRTEMDNVSREKTEYDTVMGAINGRFSQAEQDVNSKKDGLSLIKSRVEATDGLIKEIQESVSEYTSQIEVLKSKKSMLEELTEKYEGFAKSVKAVVEKAGNPDVGINARPVADIISVEPGFEQAVESVLGDLTSAVIVDSREDAAILIRHMKEQKVGRADFFIMRDAADSIPAAATEGNPGLLPMAGIVRCPDEYAPVVRHLLRDAYLVESVDAADRFFREYRNGKFVTRDGYLRQGPRVFDGVVVEADISVLGRKEKINDIGKKVDELSVFAEEAVLRRGEQEALLREYRARQALSEEDLRRAEISLANIESEKDAVAKNMKRIDDEYVVLESEILEEQTEIDSMVKRGEELNSELNAAEEEALAVQDLMTGLEAAIKEKSGSKESLLLCIADLKGELSSIRISYDNVESNLKLREEECLEVERDADDKRQAAGQAERRAEELSNDITQFEAEREALLANRKHLEALRAELVNEKTRAQEEYGLKERVMRECESELERLRNDIRDMDVRMTEVRYRRTALVDRISQSYKEDIGTINMEIDENTNWEELKENVEELKIRLEKMGPVNLVAIEEHKELEERYTFLLRQRDDLVKAKDDLHKAILKINATTKKLFIETFQKVQVEFRNYFRMLFGGGQAEIFLLDDRDVLESGIEIVVRPPGKKLQNILLLSGGEKALTAIALMFAIFKVNPSPFCVLDEIDAPLDEININRFTRVLQEFLKISQFIIITHNKKTIQMADVLYGITMAERGVSKIVSVRFSENADANKDTEEVLV